MNYVRLADSAAVASHRASEQEALKPPLIEQHRTRAA